MSCDFSSSNETRPSVGQKRKAQRVVTGADIAKRVCMTIVTDSQTKNPPAPGSRYKCPVATRFSCSLMFTSKTEANAHRDAQHPEPFPCPVAFEYRCNRSFCTAGCSKRTFKSAPDEVALSCCKRIQLQEARLAHAPKATEYTHAPQLRYTTVPCPLSEEHKCEKFILHSDRRQEA